MPHGGAEPLIRGAEPKAISSRAFCIVAEGKSKKVRNALRKDVIDAGWALVDNPRDPILRKPGNAILTYGKPATEPRLIRAVKIADRSFHDIAFASFAWTLVGTELVRVDEHGPCIRDHDWLRNEIQGKDQGGNEPMYTFAHTAWDRALLLKWLAARETQSQLSKMGSASRSATLVPGEADTVHEDVGEGDQVKDGADGAQDIDSNNPSAATSSKITLKHNRSPSASPGDATADNKRTKTTDAGPKGMINQVHVDQRVSSSDNGAPSPVDTASQLPSHSASGIFIGHFEAGVRDSPTSPFGPKVLTDITGLPLRIFIAVDSPYPAWDFLAYDGTEPTRDVDFASIIVLPMSNRRHPTHPEHIRCVKLAQSRKSMAAVSMAWLNQSIVKRAVQPVKDYLVTCE